jgi:colanic acid biosynthesis glycosyl transferase WcaI
VKILYVSQYFPPEIGAPSARVSELARYWVRSGHDVQVLTGFPNHPTGVVPEEYRGKLKRLIMREDFEGANVLRTWLWPLPNRKPWERMANYASFAKSASITGTLLSRPDIVIGTSPQLLVGLAAWWISRVKRAPFVFEVRDLWPESLDAVGVVGEQTKLYRVLKRVSAFLYQHSDHIVVVTPAFKEEIIRNYRIAEEKISIVNNGVETELFSPNGDNVRHQLSLGDGFVVGYIGTMGFAHGLNTVLEAAEILRCSAPDVRFLLIGEGADKSRLKALIAEKNLNNLLLLDGQPREQIASIIRSVNVCLVPLRKSDVFKTVIPTKMLEFMSCGRPVILGVEGQAQEIVEAARAGICIEPEDPEQLADAILKLKSDSQLTRQLGINGRDYIVQHMSREQTAHDYERVLANVLGQESAVATTV